MGFPVTASPWHDSIPEPPGNRRQHRLAELVDQDGQLLQIMDAALADAGRRAGEHLACRPGCTQCCHGAFAINELDARRLTRAMHSMRVADPERAFRIERRARDYVAEFGDVFPGDPATGILGQTEEDEEAFEEFANDAACPALDPETGLCEVYEARPMTCRVFGPPVRVEGEGEAYSVCELCFTTASEEEIAACAMDAPYAEEERLLADLAESHGPGEPLKDPETIVAFCLLPA